MKFILTPLFILFCAVPVLADCGSRTLTDYPTFNNGVTDDSPAFNSAFEDLAECGGGTLYVPSGKFAVRSTVFKDFVNRAQKIVIRGNGSSSQIFISAGSQNAFVFENVDLLIENLMFVGGGINGANTADALNAIFIIGGRSTIQHNIFVGLGAITQGAATIRFSHRAVGTVEFNQFWGCRSVSAFLSGTIIYENYGGVVVRNNKFLDYSPTRINGNFYSTNSQANLAWVVLLNPYVGDALLTKTVVINDNEFDEGGYFAIYTGNSRLIPRMQLNRNTVNVGGGAGYALHNIIDLEIEGGFAGYHTSGNQVDAIRLVNVHYPTIKDFQVAEDTLANRLTVDAGTKMLRLIDSPFPFVSNDAQAWRIEDGAVIKSSGLMTRPKFLNGKQQ